MTRSDITTTWAENAMKEMDLDTMGMDEIADELADLIFIALDIQEWDEDTQEWAWHAAGNLALNIA